MLASARCSVSLALQNSRPSVLGARCLLARVAQDWCRPSFGIHARSASDGWRRTVSLPLRGFALCRVCASNPPSVCSYGDSPRWHRSEHRARIGWSVRLVAQVCAARMRWLGPLLRDSQRDFATRFRRVVACLSFPRGRDCVGSSVNGTHAAIEEDALTKAHNDGRWGTWIGFRWEPVMWLLGK